MKRIILITGASGSGGSYLAEHILKKKNSQVIGLIRNKKKKQSYNLKILKSEVDRVYVPKKKFVVKKSKKADGELDVMDEFLDDM